MLFNNFILIYSFLIANPMQIVNKKNPKISNVKNVKMAFEETNNDYDNFGNPINKSNEFFFNVNHELNETYDEYPFPSFYQFMRKREIDELLKKHNYLDDSNKLKSKSYSENNEIIEPSSKDLKLLTSISAIEWARTWIYEMIHVTDYFPTFMYQDMFRLREFGQKNNSKNYFYIGYYPSDVNSKEGPFYIGAFELVPSMREFRTHVIIQNPYHCAENVYDENKIKDFKKELLSLCKDSSVVFRFSNLENNNDQRYYYSWLYEE